MSKARDLGDLLDTDGDVVSGSLDNVPTPSKTSIEALGIDVPAANLTGSIADARIPESAVTQHVDLIPLLKNIKLSSLRIATLEDNAFNLMVDGVTDAFTTEAGVNTGTSTNETYNATTNTYENLSTATSRNEGTASSLGSWPNYTICDRGFSLPNNVTVSHVWYYTTKARAISIKICLENSSTNIDVVKHQSGFSHTGSGWEEFAFTSSYTIPSSGTYRVAVYAPTANNSTDETTPYTGSYYSGDVTGSASTWNVWSSSTAGPKMGITYASGVANVILVSNSTTAEVEPNTIEALVLHQPVDNVTLNTDYTLEVSINNGSNYDTITMTDVGTFDTGVNILRGSVDVSARTGTTIIWRQKTLNTKRQNLHGIALGWS